MYTMKEVSKISGLSYDTLKFYCNEGLIPNVKRDSHNYRVFDDRDLAWIESLLCLKKCGLSIKSMKEFLALCLEGESTIPQRQQILQEALEGLEKKKQELEESMDYIHRKQIFYQDVLEKKVPYFSYLLDDCQDHEDSFQSYFNKE